MAAKINAKMDSENEPSGFKSISFSLWYLKNVISPDQFQYNLFSNI